MRHIHFSLFTTLLLLTTACQKPMQEQTPTITKEAFGFMPDGSAIDLYTLSNNNGMTVKITNYGAIITSIQVPDKAGRLGEVTLGYDQLDGYLEATPYFGAVVGRYGNRIAKGQFTLNDVSYTLVTNNGPNHLHGGTTGFDKMAWQVDRAETQASEASLALTYISPHGEEGYPGTLTTTVIYTLTNKNALKIDYVSTTDQPTILNLTNHTYFNLKDAGASSILDHKMMIMADHFTPVDSTLIPTGELRSVAGTPFDFLQPTTIGSRIEAEDEQLAYAGGYDHNYVLNGHIGELRKVAEVYEPVSGRVMEVQSTQAGVQFYTGNFLNGRIVGRGGIAFQKRSAFCLETQHYPDSPNQSTFPTVVLKPGENYQHTTIYAFSMR